MRNKHEIWIELPKPEDEADAAEIAEKANRMMRRLGTTDGWYWYWSVQDNRWCWGGDMGSKVLSDNGNWFNLDYLGRGD